MVPTTCWSSAARSGGQVHAVRVGADRAVVVIGGFGVEDPPSPASFQYAHPAGPGPLDARDAGGRGGAEGDGDGRAPEAEQLRQRLSEVLDVHRGLLRTHGRGW